MRLFRIVLLCVATVAITSAALQVQAQSKKKKTMYTPESGIPDKPTIDTRIDNMSYWRRLAHEGLVPVAPETRIPKATRRGSMITGSRLVVDDSPDVPVTSENSTQTENSIFVDPNDKNRILQSNNSTENPVGSLFGANYFYSLDGAVTWGGSIQGAGGGNTGDPTTAINRDGRMFVGFIHSSGGQGISYSDDGGMTWIPVLVASSPGGWGSMLDKNHMWIDNSLSSPYEGNLYNAWTNFGGANDREIEISRSTTNGESWEAAINISNGVNAGSHNQGVNIQTGPNGEVYAVWAIYDSWPSDESAIAMARSFDGGETWDAPRRIISNIRGIRTTETSKEMRVNSFPVMAVDISNGTNSGNIYICWANIGVPGVNNGPDIDVYVAISTDQGETFGTPIRVNQDEMGQGKEHYLPWITSDPVYGNVAVIFYDDRNVGSSEVETFCATSVDGGQNWEDFRVSDVAFTPTPIPGLAAEYMGDYLGIASRDRMVYPVWPDNRLGYHMTFVSPFELGPPPDQPWVTYVDVLVNDTVEGNGNGHLDYEESASLHMTMKNIGDTPGYGVNVTLSSENPYVEILQAEASFGDLESGDELTVTDAFSVSLADNVPNEERIIFTLTAVDDNDTTMVSNFSLPVSAPEMVAGGMSIDDPTGNGNGRLDAGETVEIAFEVSNEGAFSLENVVASLVCPSNFVTLNTDEAEIELLDAGEVVSVIYSVTADPATPVGTSAEFILHLEGGAYEVEKSYLHLIGLVVEDWESGDFSSFDWQFSGQGEWSLVEDPVYEGIYALKSDAINDQQSAELSLDYAVARDDEISFFYKVSSEQSYDHLKFYIDGQVVGQWSGEEDWSEATFPVTEGEHNFRWTYEKDMSVSGGMDCAWIDYIILPPLRVTSAYAGEDLGTCELTSVILEGANATYFDEILWETTGTGMFDDATLVNPTYTPSQEDMDAGMVTLTMTVIGPAITASDVAVLTISPALEALMPEEGNICAGDVYTVSDVDAMHYAEVLWSTDGDGAFDDASILMPQYTPGTMDQENGEVTLTATFVALEGCEDLTLSQLLSIHALPTALLSGADSELCIGDSLSLSIELTGVAPWTLSTTDGEIVEVTESSFSYYYTPTETLDYAISEVVDAQGCTNEGEGVVQLTVNPRPQVELGEDQTICHNHTILLDAGSEGSTYSWSTGETTQTIEVDSTGVGFSGMKTITVTVTNEFSCVTEDEIVITIKDCSGLDDFAEAIGLKIYPNPTNGILNISLNAKKAEDYRVEIRDNRNVLIQEIGLGTIRGSYHEKLDLTHLVDGVYLLTLKTAENTYPVKIVINR
ncbi:MAG: hypothetical protein CSA95_07335 [Bacteroidetes bacterium]|nr:MAG: hypothetical protein CSA95_07335 [Bacteroidota bacterium]PIE87925.1 MAG: hypothetical protein CSA04_04490 [Bacteroidota bacterium]